MGSFLSGLFGDDDENENTNNNTKNNTDDAGNANANTNSNADSTENGKLTLHQEELDINKNKVQTGEVTLSKEIVEENKTVDVPVTREEVVIERKSLNNEASDAQITSGETIRIPVSEEQVQIGKHTVTTGEVSAYKRETQETQTINETLKKEEARIDKNGNPNVVSEDSSGNLQ